MDRNGRFRLRAMAFNMRALNPDGHGCPWSDSFGVDYRA